MSAFIINTELNNVTGFVQNPEVAADKAGANSLVVSSAKDLEVLSLQQLTDLYNTWVMPKEGSTEKERITKFKIAKDKAAERVFAVLSSIDLALLTQFDKQEEKVIETKAEEVAQQDAVNGKKPRKERDSKLQRMRRAFWEKNPDGTYKQWSIKELMERCGTTERITHVYISILRSQSDRFVMKIEKLQESKEATPLFVYSPSANEKNPPKHEDQQQAA